MSISEFESDVKRISFFGRLVEKDAPPRQLINSVIIIYNLFGFGAIQLAEFKLTEGAFSIFKTISILLNRIVGEIPEEHEWLTKEIFKNEPSSKAI